MSWKKDLFSSSATQALCSPYNLRSLLQLFTEKIRKCLEQFVKSFTCIAAHVVSHQVLPIVSFFHFSFIFPSHFDFQTCFFHTVCTWASCSSQTSSLPLCLCPAARFLLPLFPLDNQFIFPVIALFQYRINNQCDQMGFFSFLFYHLRSVQGSL